jgi:hypothetical protein
VKLIAHKLEHGSKYDRLRALRSDSSFSDVMMPRQGILPHDLLHALVESRLAMSDGFLGLVFKGADIAFTEQSFRDYIDPIKHFEVAQAESVVESLQAQLWSGVFDAELFLAGVQGACAMRGVPEPNFKGVDVQTDLFDAAQQLNAEWQLVPAHAEFTLSFPLPTRVVETV